MQPRRSAQALVVFLVSTFFVVSSAASSVAAVSRTEAESLAAPGGCWGVTSYAPLSGGSGRTCSAPSVSLTWIVSVAPGQTATVGLYGYRDAAPRSYRVRVDNTTWTQGTLMGASAPSALFFTTAQLNAGSHTVDLESVTGGGGFTLDYYELNSSPTSTATTALPAPVTTLATPGTCDIRPADGQDAITAAVKACPDGSTVRFPAGRTYHQSDKINVVSRKNLVIDGNGSTFISSALNDNWASIYQARPNWQLVEGQNVTLKNMTIRGNLPASGRGILPGNQYNAGVIVYGGNGIYVTDVSVYSVFGEFVVSNPSGFYHGGGALDGQVPTNVYVTRLHGQSAARQCVSVTASQGFWLQDSTMSDCFQNGVDVEPDVAGEHIRDAHILRNTVSGFYFSAISVPTAYQAGDVDGVEVRGNKTTSTSDTCYPGVLVGGVQNNSNPIYNVVVADNTLRTLYEGVKDTYVASGSVTGNDVTITMSPNYCGPPVALAVHLINSPSVVVNSNVTHGYGQ